MQHSDSLKFMNNNECMIFFGGEKRSVIIVRTNGRMISLLGIKVRESIFIAYIVWFELKQDLYIGSPPAFGLCLKINSGREEGTK